MIRPHIETKAVRLIFERQLASNVKRDLFGWTKMNDRLSMVDTWLQGAISENNVLVILAAISLLKALENPKFSVIIFDLQL